MRNRIDVLESAVTYCLTTIKELEGYIATKAAENVEVIDAEEAVIE
tara:strand:- start:284 stop:421 length:138 start_codon:yes stop_codon:yes gene_type:complete